MPNQKQSRGLCTFCQKEMTKGGLSRHLSSCAERQKIIEETANAKEKEQTLYHLQVQDNYSVDFWLHLEVNGLASLKDLDYYLRAIWLECCGHMSQFSIGGWTSSEIPKSKKIERAFGSSAVLTHIYDFGTSSETFIKFINQRQGKPLTKHPIFLMARNNPPDVTCMKCKKPGTHMCMECIYEDEETGILCDTHTENHPHDDYGEPMPLVNSPRLGMCGYDGPATPPY